MTLQHHTFLSTLHSILPANQTTYSPFSIHIALSLIALCLKPNSSSHHQIDQFLKSLSHTNNEKIVKELKRFCSNHPENLNFTCAIFPLSKSRLKTRFRKEISNRYQADCIPLPYNQNPRECRNKINDYISNETKGEIQNLVSEKMLNTQTKNVILNTIHFHGLWKEPFNAEHTVKKDFILLSGKKTAVHMMSTRSRTVNFFEYQNGVTGISLPFATEGMEMVLLKPLDHTRLEDAEKFLFSSPKQFEKQLSLLQIPRFALKAKLNLKNALSQAGVRDIFNPCNRDYTEMMENVEELYLSAFIHEAVMKVDEQGTTASASTTGVIRTLSMKQREEFVLDCPFVCKILMHGEVIFVGRVLDPNRSD